MRARSIIAIAVAALVIPSGAHANPITQDACPGTATVTTWTQLGNDVLENLLFTEQGLWISDSTSGAIRRFDAAKNELAGIAGVGSPGGMQLGADGMIYAAAGDSIANALTRTPAAKVIRFDPEVRAPSTYASGMNMANGLLIAPNGDVFVSNDVDTGLFRIARDDPAHPTLFNNTWGTNGLAIIGNTLYSNVTFDSRSPIEASDLSTGAHHTAFQLSFGVADLQPAVHTDGDPAQPLIGLKGLDDLTTDGVRYLYPVANGMGELLRVDTTTGVSCLVASGLANASSVRIAPEASAFADHDPATIDFYTTEFTGNIHKITFKPA